MAGSKVADYLSLTKPRLALLNIFVAIAGFCVGAEALFDWRALALMAAGLFCIVGSACAFNNLYDRGIDARMARTQMRPVAAGRISPRGAFAFGLLLLAAGMLLLRPLPPLTLAAALAGFLSYVFVYTPLKHKSSLALFVGAFAGATPPVVGFAAAGGPLGWTAFLLFAFLYLWQLPHFMAIAVYRFGEYRSAGVPLFIREEKSADVQRRARTIFKISLWTLTLAALIAIGYRLF